MKKLGSFTHKEVYALGVSTGQTTNIAILLPITDDGSGLIVTKLIAAQAMVIGELEGGVGEYSVSHRVSQYDEFEVEMIFYERYDNSGRIQEMIFPARKNGLDAFFIKGNQVYWNIGYTNQPQLKASLLLNYERWQLTPEEYLRYFN